MSFIANDFNREQKDPDRDGRVGDVERPKMIGPPVDVHEVDDRTDDQAVDEIPRGTADDDRREGADADSGGSPDTQGWGPDVGLRTGITT